MRRILAGPLAVFLLGACGAARGADDPQALIRRAIKEMGGEEVLSRRVAVTRKVKGKLEAAAGLKLNLTVAGDLMHQAGGRQTKMAFDIDLSGNKIRMVLVLDGDNSWQSVNGAVQPLLPPQREALRGSAHQERVAGLVDLLKDKGFTLAALPDAKVEGRAAKGVKVSYKGQPDVQLYFDKGSGLLVKYGYRGKVMGTNKEGLQEVLLRDYRPVSSAAAEEKALRAAGLKTDGKSLLEFLKGLVPHEAQLAKARALVRKLGDPAFAVREQAQADLTALGEVALPALNEASRGGDLEVVRRAQRCIQAIKARGRLGSNTAVVAAAVRLVALRRPPGGADLLLRALVGADEPLAQEVRAALASLAETDPRSKAVLRAALKDKDAARREAAAAALGEDGGAYLKRPGRRLYLTGLRQAMRQTTLVDGKPQIDLEIVEVHCFNRFHDQEFAKPGG
jgi:hypothetical protein